MREACKWFHGLALMTLTFFIVGCDEPIPPDQADSRGQIWFEERAAAAGLNFVYHSGHRERFLLPEIDHGWRSGFVRHGW